MARLPKHWDGVPKATLYGVSPYAVDADEIGLYLQVDGQIVRYRLDGEAARSVAELFASYLDRCHSPTSSGSPSVAVSTPDDGVNA